jgi:hypothetical protein
MINLKPLRGKKSPLAPLLNIPVVQKVATQTHYVICHLYLLHHYLNDCSSLSTNLLLTF